MKTTLSQTFDGLDLLYYAPQYILCLLLLPSTGLGRCDAGYTMMGRSWRKNTDKGPLSGEGWDFLICFFIFLFFGVGLVLRTVSAGSLTRRCGRGESAVRGRAVGFRVGHGKGHWAGHWGRWRQQEGAWHFALAAPVWLQTTQIGSGGRHATIRRHGMKTGRSLGGQVQKNIHDGGRRSGRGGAMVEGGRGGGWETTTKGMMYVDGIFHEGVKNNNHHRV